MDIDRINPVVGHVLTPPTIADGPRDETHSLAEPLQRRTEVWRVSTSRRPVTLQRWLPCLQPDAHEIGYLEAEACEQEVDGEPAGDFCRDAFHPALI